MRVIRNIVTSYKIIGILISLSALIFASKYVINIFFAGVCFYAIGIVLEWELFDKKISFLRFRE